MVFLDEDKERSMATSVQTEPSTEIARLKEANFFELSHGKSTLSYTVSNIAGDPLVSYFDGKETKTFVGDQVSLESTTLGTLVTVLLQSSVDGPRHFLTLVLPVILVGEKHPEKISLPVIFHTTVGFVLPRPGPRQTYDVQIFSGTASIEIT
jgi:hypothetical protein